MNEPKISKNLSVIKTKRLDEKEYKKILDKQQSPKQEKKNVVKQSLSEQYGLNRYSNNEGQVDQNLYIESAKAY